MYYRVYGVMSKTGFYTELFQRNTKIKALEAVKQMDAKIYPMFAVTEHKEKNMPALYFCAGNTVNAEVIMFTDLIIYKPSPMLDCTKAEEIFTALDKFIKEKANASV